jgi:hypothetical protein
MKLFHRMKFLSACIAVAPLLGLVAPAQAQSLPGPRYVKKAVFVRIHWDRSFYEYWGMTRKPKQTVAQINAMVTTYFDEARADYLNNAAMHNIKLILLNDFDRVTGPMADYVAPGSTSELRRNNLLATMRSRLRTGAVSKTVPSGVTYDLGRTINWVLVYGDYYNQGEVEAIGGISSADGNLFVSTSGGDGTAGRPISEMIHAAVLETLEHETGHLLGGKHGTRNELADCPTNHKEIMCSSGIPRDRRFGTANYNRVAGYLRHTLQRCSSAFNSQNSCVNAVSNMCSAIGDYTQIQFCIDANVAANCQDICTAVQKTSSVVINTLPDKINNGTTVNAGSVRQ